MQLLNKISLLIQSSALGISLKNAPYQAAWMCYRNGRPSLKNLFYFDEKTKQPHPYVKPLDNENEFLENIPLCIDIQSERTLTKSIEVPFIKQKEIKDALPFLIDSQLSVASDTLFYDAFIIEKRENTSLISLVAHPKDEVLNSLETASQLHLLPDSVIPKEVALSLFAHWAAPTSLPVWILSKDNNETTVILAFQGKLIKSHTTSDPAIDTTAWIQRSMASIIKGLGSEAQSMLLVVGSLKTSIPLEKLVSGIEGVLSLKEIDGFSPDELSAFACPIGLALNELPETSLHLSLAPPQDVSYKLWKKWSKPILATFCTSLLFSLALFTASNSWSSLKTRQIAEKTATMLSNFDGGDQFQDSLTTQEGLTEALFWMDSSLNETPNLYPLQPQTPRVSDFLLWLAKSPHVYLSTAQSDSKQDYLTIQSLHYSMIKRPEPSKKMERYLVKIELEFTASSPRLARQFHESLIEANDMVDPKEEIKWTAAKNSYRVSFYLKDKTGYSRS